MSALATRICSLHRLDPQSYDRVAMLSAGTSIIPLSLHGFLRPLRVGILVRPDEPADLVAAVRYNTAHWGGLLNPLIACTDDGEHIDRLIRAFHLDILRPVCPEADAGIVSRYPDLDPPAVAQNWDANSSGWEPAGLDIRPALGDMARAAAAGSEFRFTLPTWFAEDPLATEFAVLLGSYSDDQGDVASRFRSLPGANYPNLSDAATIVELAASVTPIGATTRHIYRHDVTRREQACAFYPAVDDLRSLVDFWNLRATGLRPILIRATPDERLDALARARLATLLDDQGAGRALVLRVYSTAGPAQSAEIQRRLSSVAPSGVAFQPPAAFILAGLAETALQYSVPGFQPTKIEATLSRTEDGPRLTLVVPPAPVPFELDHERKSAWALHLDSIFEGFFDGHTLTPPPLPRLTSWFASRASGNHHNLRLGHHGLSILCDTDERMVTLLPVRTQDVVVQTLRRVGLRASPNKPGRIASVIVSQMGGLDACRVFKIAGVRRLIREGNPQSGLDQAGVLSRIANAESESTQLSEYQDLYIEYRTKAKLEPDDVFSFLLRHQILTAGLNPCCPQCGLDFWLPLDAIADVTTCELCQSSFRLSPQLPTDGKWKYRVKGIFGRGDNQEGSLPVILTLMQLLRRHPGSEELLFSTAVGIDGIDGDIDLSLIERGSYWQRPTVLLGECKSRNGIENVEMLTKCRETILTAGLSCVLLFAKSDVRVFEERELELFRALRRDNISVILFTSQELEPYEPYYSTGSGPPVPHPYGHSLAGC